MKREHTDVTTERISSMDDEASEKWYSYKAKQFAEEIELEELCFLPESIRDAILEKIGTHLVKRAFWFGRQYEKSAIGCGIEPPLVVPAPEVAQNVSQTSHVA